MPAASAARRRGTSRRRVPLVGGAASIWVGSPRCPLAQGFEFLVAELDFQRPEVLSYMVERQRAGNWQRCRGASKEPGQGDRRRGGPVPFSDARERRRPGAAQGEIGNEDDALVAQ